MANLTLRSVKGSPLTNAELDGNFEYFTGSHAITGSLVVSSSITSNGYTVVTSNQTGSLIVNTGSLASTGSNTFNGTQTISGSILISGSIVPNTVGSTTSSFSLGSATNAWKDLWVSNGTINFLNSAGQVQASLGAGSSGTTFTGGTNISGQLTVTPTSITSSQPAQIYQNQDPSCNFRLSLGTNINVALYYYGIWSVLPFDRTYTSYFIIGTPSDEDSYTVYLPPYKNSGHAPGKPVTVYNMNSNPATLPLKIYGLAQYITSYNPSDPKNITGLLNTAGLISGSYGQTINNFYTTASIPSGYKGTFELINVGAGQALSASFTSYPTVYEGIANNYNDSTSMGDGNELRWKLVSVLPI
jgi:hypothetical protein